MRLLKVRLIFVKRYFFAFLDNSLSNAKKYSQRFNKCIADIRAHLCVQHVIYLVPKLAQTIKYQCTTGLPIFLPFIISPPIF